jgi:4-hydroxy-3-methylbut-2-en-1-yl diphosphate reductase
MTTGSLARGAEGRVGRTIRRDVFVVGLDILVRAPLTRGREDCRLLGARHRIGRRVEEMRSESAAGNDSVPPAGKLLFLLRPRGFCAGVVRAIDVVRLALAKLGPPVYVRKEIVHNRYVVDELAAQGAYFVEELDEVPEAAIVIFSAHGVSPEVWKRARQRKLRIVDATCPLVTKVHLEVLRYARENYTIILIGHRDHDEVIGTLGEAPACIRLISTLKDVDSLEVPAPQRVVYLTQTTLSVDDTEEIVARLKQRFPAIISPPGQDICYATQNRQTAVKAIAAQVDLILVVGARNSSNSNRLVEVAQRRGTQAHLIGGPTDIRAEWIDRSQRVGITAGASTPEILVEQVVAHLEARGYPPAEEVEVIEEDVHFSLPAELK